MSICVITHPPFAREYKIYLYCKLRQYMRIRKIKILLKPTYCGLISI